MKATMLALLCCVACRAAPAPVPVAPAPKVTPPRAAAAARVGRSTDEIETSPTPANAEPFPATVPFRLPHTFEPTRYKARLAIEDRRVRGHIDIEGDLREQVSLIWLHAADLAITRATATSGETVVPLEFSPPRHDQVLGLRSKNALAPGRWTISIDYSAPIREQEPPIKNRYGGQDGDPPALGVFRRPIGMSSYVFTQSEPISARKIFPCLDEPDRKVPWQLTLDVAKDLVAASNTPVVRETPIDDAHRRVEFAETRPLPSYLIAFAVGPFEVVDAGKAKSGTPIRILAIRGRAAAVASSAKAAPRILDLLETWIGVPYAYGKLDLVDVPHLGFGAMENPGLVTVNDKTLEASDDTSTITHELAHQWFGNLVTCAWWDDIWLNESFATFMTAKIEAMLAGESGIEDPAEARANALSHLTHSSIARRSVVSLADLDFKQFAWWPSIESGSNFLKGVEASLGGERFQKALRVYLTSHADGVVATHDLMNAFASAVGTPVEGVLTRLLDGNVMSLEPRELCAGKPRLHFDKVPDDVTVCVAYDRDGKRAESCATLGDKVHDVSLPSKACPRWVLPNAGALGLYQVHWTKQLVDELLARGWGSLTNAEKWMVLDEVDGSAQNLAIFIKLVTEPGHVTSARDVAYLASTARFVPPDLRQSFDAWIVAHFGARARELHFKMPDGVTNRTKLELVSLVNLVARTHDPELTADAMKLAKDPGNHANDWFLESLLTLTAAADPTVANDLLEQTLDANYVNVPRYEAAVALRQLPNLVELIKANAGKVEELQLFVREELFKGVCDADSRKELAAVLPSTNKKSQFVRTEILDKIDQCIAYRAPLEPLFRSWLAPKPSVNAK